VLLRRPSRKGKAAANVSAEPSSVSAADALNNYEKVVAQNCTGYHELERGPSTLAGLSGLSLRFNCSDPRQGNIESSVAMASGSGELIFFYATAPTNEYDALRTELDAIRNSFRLNAGGDASKLAALEPVGWVYD